MMMMLVIFLLFASDGVVRVAWPEINFEEFGGTAARRAVFSS